MGRLFIFSLALLLLSGCTSYGVVQNAPLEGAPKGESYSIRSAGSGPGARDLSLMLAFSGGATRAAPLANAKGVFAAQRNALSNPSSPERQHAATGFLSTVSAHCRTRGPAWITATVAGNGQSVATLLRQP